MDQRKSISVVNYFSINGIPAHSIVYMTVASIVFVCTANGEIKLKIHQHNFLDRIQNIFGIYALLSTSTSYCNLRNVR